MCVDGVSRLGTVYHRSSVLRWHTSNGECGWLGAVVATTTATCKGCVCEKERERCSSSALASMSVCDPVFAFRPSISFFH